jgi:hypothetical protein
MEATPELLIKANVGGVILTKVVDGKTPEHYLWKKKLEKVWSSKWGTLAKLTKYRYRMGIDPSFVVERPEFKKEALHWYEWILCSNGSIIYLFDDKAKLFTLYTTKQLGNKVLRAVKEASIALTFDGRFTMDIRFPLSVLQEVCELVGARRTRKGAILSAEAKRKLVEQGRGSRFKSAPPGLQSS